MALEFDVRITCGDDTAAHNVPLCYQTNDACRFTKGNGDYLLFLLFNYKVGSWESKNPIHTSSCTLYEFGAGRLITACVRYNTS